MKLPLRLALALSACIAGVILVGCDKADQSTDSTLNEELGQRLSFLGAVIPLEKGPGDDQFFLTFDNINGVTYDRPDNPMLVISPTDLVDEAEIGIRTFDEIAATYASILAVDRLAVYTNDANDTVVSIGDSIQGKPGPPSPTTRCPAPVVSKPPASTCRSPARVYASLPSDA